MADLIETTAARFSGSRCRAAAATTTSTTRCRRPTTTGCARSSSR
jgi:hypothetical protein